MTISTPPDRRFRRAQVAPVRRRRVWRRHTLWLLRLVLALAVMSYVGYRVADLAAHADVFRISQIVVRGNSHLSTGEVLALFHDLRSQSILTADVEQWRSRLLDSPWVEQAVIHRVLPSTVEVTVVERVPIGIARVGGRLLLVDRTGRVVDEFGPQYSAFDLPVLDGLSNGSPSDVSVDPARAGLAGAFMTALEPRSDLAGRVSQVDLSDPRDLVVILDGDPALIHLGDERFLERLEAYVDLLPALHERVPAIDYVDLRFGERVYVRPADQSEEGSPARRATALPDRF